jgi:tetratricopeptide (TPR) repeat protein
VTHESPDGGQEEQAPNWLHRQIQRVRDIQRRDIVIAQIGPGARNIVVGSRNIQINVGNRNLTLPVLLVPLLLLVIVGFLAYPLAEPIWNPAQMSGQFRIAVAEFGEIDDKGHARPSENGHVLSQWLFEALQDEYQQNADVELARAIEIWHDSRTDTAQNFKFGFMHGATPGERRESAAKLADRLNAHMVIYGNLVTEGATQELDMEFYLSPQVNDETASLIGPHRLGKPIPLPVPFDTDTPEANIVIGEKIEVRGDALFWLTMGLTQQVLGRSEQALATLRRAETELQDWPENDGKEILYFFIGREELFLAHSQAAEASFRKALEIEPDYARAQVALGSAYLQQARAVKPEERLGEPHYLEKALDNHRQGLELALSAEDSLIEAVARSALAKSYRLLGETHYFLDDYEQANRYFDLAIAEVEQVIQVLADTRQYRLLAQAYEAQGAAYLQQGDILRRQHNPKESQAHFELARTAYQQCIDQGSKAFFDDILREKIIEQGCQRYFDVTENYLSKLQGEQP